VLGQVAHRALGGLVAVPIRMAANRDSRPVSTGLGAHCRVYGHLTAPRALNRRLCLTVTPVVAVPRAEPQSERRRLDPMARASMIVIVPQGIL